MKDDFYFWCFVLWLGSILEWGWTLTVESKTLRRWLGGTAIIFNLIMGIMLFPLLTRLSATLCQKDHGTTLYELIVNIVSLSCLIPADIFMAVMLKKIEKRQNNLQKSLQENSLDNGCNN